MTSNTFAIYKLVFWTLSALAPLAAAAGSELQEAIVVRGRFLLRMPTGGWVMDLPQDGNTAGNLHIYGDDAKKKNDNQDFVLIPAAKDAWFICAQKTGAVLTAKDGVPFGVLKPERIEIEGHWVLEKTGESDSIRIKNKGLGKYLALENPEPKSKDDFVFSSQANAAIFVWQVEVDRPETFLLSMSWKKAPEPPDPTSLVMSQYAQRTEETFVGGRLVPYFEVDDDKFYREWSKRVLNQPVYRIRNFEYWQRTFCEVTDGKEEVTVKIAHRNTTSASYVNKETYKKEEKSWIKNEARLDADAHFVPFPAAKVNLKAMVGISSGHSTSIITAGGTSNSATVEITDEEARTVKLPKSDTKTLHAGWVKIKGTQLERIDPSEDEGQIIRKVEMINPQEMVKRSFPDSSPK